MRPVHLIIAAIVVLAVVGFAFNQSTDPSEDIDAASRAVEGATD